MRPKINPQPELDLQPSNLKLTNDYFAKYEAVSNILDQNPEIVNAVHRDLEKARDETKQDGARNHRFDYSSDTALRVVICQVLEGLSLRGVVVRIDDSHQLRRFTRIDSGPMMDYSTLCLLKNAIQPQTWKRVNRLLARYAVERDLIHGEALRMDTTAVETNIHYPTDSSLLWDSYRVLERLIAKAREIDRSAVGSGRIHLRAVKHIHLGITRKGRKGRSNETLKPLYGSLIDHVEGICDRAMSVAAALIAGIESQHYAIMDHAVAEWLVAEIAHYRELACRVIDQSRRRVLDGEAVPNLEKLFSLFEPHTELLKRGKAGKEIEFGHMIQIQQVQGKFITDYETFENKPVEHQLIPAALQSHEKLFGSLPQQLAADKGYYRDMETLHALEQDIEVVSIAKKGRRTEAETEREHDPLFRHAQRFRSGVEGTISFLKRVLGLFRCFNRGWSHFVSTVGATIFGHNLLILARC